MQKKLSTNLLKVLLITSTIFNISFAKEISFDSIKDIENIGVSSKVTTFNGKKALVVEIDDLETTDCSNCTYLLFKNTSFKNGTIEVDITSTIASDAPPWAKGFVGVVFRVNDDHSKLEGFYLRPVNATLENRKNFSSQYFSLPGKEWYYLRGNFPGKYETYADVKPGKWAKLKIEVSGQNATFYIDGKKILHLDDLYNGKDLEGKIGLFVGPAAKGYFSNLKITHK